MTRLLQWLGFTPRASCVSQTWLQEQAASERENFEGVCIDWPIKKQVDALAWWNRTKLRKSA